VTYYDEKFEQGLEYQDHVTELLYDNGMPIVAYSSRKKQYLGENKAGYEIKLDNNIKKTGNIYIEFAEKSNENNANFVASGIFRDDNTWLYIIGDYEKTYIFGKKQLIRLYETKKYEERQIATSMGFLLPFCDAEEYAEKVLVNKNYVKKKMSNKLSKWLKKHKKGE